MTSRFHEAILHQRLSREEAESDLSYLLFFFAEHEPLWDTVRSSLSIQWVTTMPGHECMTVVCFF